MNTTTTQMTNSIISVLDVQTLAEAIANGDYDAEYGEFIMNNPQENGLTICNGDELLIAMESCYLIYDFAYYMLQKQVSDKS